MAILKFYTKPDCPLCDEVRDLLNESGVDWEEINILESADLRVRFRNEIPVLQSGEKTWFYRNHDNVPLTRWLQAEVGNNS